VRPRGALRRRARRATYGRTPRPYRAADV
jgi:hypothetical protein